MTREKAIPPQKTPKAPAPPRTRGRPPSGPEAQAAIRQRLLDATRTVFTRVGYHGLSVELVLDESGLSRPTFYKHFRNTDEPIEELIREANESLLASLRLSVASSAAPFEAVEAALVAWRDWGTELGPMLRPLFAELHDPHSPGSAHRKRVLGILGQELVELVERFGRPRPTRVQVDALLHGMEYLGYRFHLETKRDEASWKQTRDVMLRLALALLGGPGEWAHAAALARSFDVDLAPKDEAG